MHWKEKRTDCINELRNYFKKERDEDMGELAAGLLLNFFLDKIGPEIYNQGIYDAHKFMNDCAQDLLGIQK